MPPPGEPTPPGTAPASPSASIGSIGSIGSTDAVVAQHRWRFKACYDQALAVDPEAKGTPKFTLAFDAAGNLASVTTVCSQLSKPVTECLRKAHVAMAADLDPAPNATFTVGGPC